VRLRARYQPRTERLPLHPPDASQLSAFDAHQVSVVDPYLRTDEGHAPKLSVGGFALEGGGSCGVGDVTDTLTDRVVEPPGPVHWSVNVLFEFSAGVCSLPEVAFVPLHAPEAVQLVAFVLLHVSVDRPPAVTDVGLAERLTVGAPGVGVGVGEVELTVTETERLAVPPAPVH
jgi:hypothetical protein